MPAWRRSGGGRGRSAVGGPGGEILFVTVPSEEDGGAGILAAIRAGVTGAAAVIPEPSGLDIVTAHAGAITFRLTITGKAAHASKRREGVSALDKLTVLTDALAADEAARNAAETRPRLVALGLPYPTIIGKVSGGAWASTVIDRIEAEGRYGVRLGDSWRDAWLQLQEVIAVACAADPWLRDHPASVELTGGRFSSAEIPDDHPLPAGLAAVGDTLGRRPAFLAEPYGADMRLLIHEGGTPTVIFGPGMPEVAHAPNEHVALDEVVDCARALAVWLLREVGPACYLKPRASEHQPKSSSRALAKATVWASTSASVVSGLIRAMLWNGVIRIRRFITYRCRNRSSSGSLAAHCAAPSRAARAGSGTRPGSPGGSRARARSGWIASLTPAVQRSASGIICSKAASVRTSPSVARTAASDRA